MANDKSNFGEWSLALLRVVLGIIFLYHGYIKLFVPGGFTDTVNFFAAVKIPVPLYSALLVSVVEFVGGVLLIVGFLTRWTSFVIMIEMLVAFFTVHLKNGLLVSKGGYEFVLVLIAALLVVLAKGAGKYAWGKSFKNRHLK